MLNSSVILHFGLVFYFQEKTKSKMIALFRYHQKINAFLSSIKQQTNEQKPK